MNFGQTIFAVVAALCLLGACSAEETLAEETKTRPNVIIVMTDDQGYGDLGCHGNPILKTPSLDRLYRESVRFTDFHVMALRAIRR